MFSLLREIVITYKLDSFDVDVLEEIIAKAEIYAQLELCRKLLNAIKHFDKNIPKDLLEAALNEKIDELELRLQPYLEDVSFNLALKKPVKIKFTGKFEAREAEEKEAKTMVVEEVIEKGGK